MVYGVSKSIAFTMSCKTSNICMHVYVCVRVGGPRWNLLYLFPNTGMIDRDWKMSTEGLLFLNICLFLSFTLSSLLCFLNAESVTITHTFCVLQTLLLQYFFYFFPCWSSIMKRIHHSASALRDRKEREGGRGRQIERASASMMGAGCQRQR